MSLALVVDAGRCDVTRRLAAAVGLLMSLALLLSVVEEIINDEPQWWLPAVSALACAAWSFLQCSPRGAKLLHQLRLSADGQLRLIAGDSGESKDAVLAAAWRLGPLICLRVGATTKVVHTSSGADDPQSASGFKTRDCSFMLVRSSFDEESWHGLRRWLVWHRRSRRSAAVSA